MSIAGLLIDAGPIRSPVLVQVGPPRSRRDHAAASTLLAELFFRRRGRDRQCGYLPRHQ